MLRIPRLVGQAFPAFRAWGREAWRGSMLEATNQSKRGPIGPFLIHSQIRMELAT